MSEKLDSSVTRPAALKVLSVHVSIMIYYEKVRTCYVQDEQLYCIFVAIADSPTCEIIQCMGAKIEAVCQCNILDRLTELTDDAVINILNGEI